MHGALVVWVLLWHTVVADGSQALRKEADQRHEIEQTQREEGEAILALADAALAGRPVPSDFRVEWQNDFLKAQRGAFVPFTLTIEAQRLTRPAALIYIRAVPRAGLAGSSEEQGRATGRVRNRGPVQAGLAVDAIFAVELAPEPGKVARVSRGFSVAAGEYDLYVILRERADVAAPRRQIKAAVLKQPLRVPDFWSGELTTSSVIVAERLRPLRDPLAPEDLAEYPYVIGRSEITPAADRVFGRDEELLFVFLVYNASVKEREFDVEVEYHFYRALTAGEHQQGPTAGLHPPEREGERYFNRTEPQRFNPATLGREFDAAPGDPVMAGQGVPLAGFQAGNYRLEIRVRDLLSGQSITRDVHFTVES